ncbi:MAG: hypothetical protein AAES65_11490, partial [Candidatus Thiodiazotropha sp. (ex. Lucinoma kazani)]
VQARWLTSPVRPLEIARMSAGVVQFPAVGRLDHLNGHLHQDQGRRPTHTCCSMRQRFNGRIRPCTKEVAVV